MDLQTAIKERRSIHDFQPQELESGLMKHIFSQASWAPNHRMKEPWNITVFQEEAKIDYADAVLDSYVRNGFFEGYENGKINSMKKGIRDFLVSIPHHALVYLEIDKDSHKFEEDYAAVCAYIQNVQLLAWEEGVGTLWTTSPYLNDPLFAEDLGLPPSKYKLAAVLQMGYPKKVPKFKPRSPIEEKCTFVHQSWKK
ncbi:nitroreductase [Halobacillus yeomjeoni]|uniref:nitroreductase family protein n=1 Tax=Halobacillus yeomjeoni TaxID=311194 RepID=UPI001CD3972A|nr:nitroreductase [Halobacillus yeomjeoni]MCA0984604.1 nitroreductase [Halobacillus yeomjeoni]